MTTTIKNKKTSEKAKNVETTTAVETPTAETAETTETTEEVEETAETNTTEISGKIVSVSNSLYDNRISIQLDKTFPSFDNEGNEIESDTFSIANYRAAQELANVDNFARTIKAFTLNNVTPQILSLLLTGANVTIKREFKAQGELRENSEEVYSTNCYKTTIVKYKNVFDKLTQSLILSTAKDAAKNANEIGNDFDVL